MSNILTNTILGLLCPSRSVPIPGKAKKRQVPGSTVVPKKQISVTNLSASLILFEVALEKNSGSSEQDEKSVIGAMPQSSRGMQITSIIVYMLIDFDFVVTLV